MFGFGRPKSDTSKKRAQAAEDSSVSARLAAVVARQAEQQGDRDDAAGAATPRGLDHPQSPVTEDTAGPAITDPIAAELAAPWPPTPEATVTEATPPEANHTAPTAGPVHILVAGQAGAGQRTLIDDIFGQGFGAAEPDLTPNSRWSSPETVLLRIPAALLPEAAGQTATPQDPPAEPKPSPAPPDDRPHLAWVCICAPGGGVRDREVDVVRALNTFAIPVIIVLTGQDADPGLVHAIGQIMDARHATVAAIVPVRAPAELGGPPVGPGALVAESLAALPPEYRAAFAAARTNNPSPATASAVVLP